MGIIIRPVTIDDASTVNTLSRQLGYAHPVAETVSYINSLAHRSEDAVFVAVSGTAVVGWIHVFMTLRLESGWFAEIGGLVVDAGQRGRGTGKLLLQEAERWCKGREAGKWKVRSNVIRSDAHRFYRDNGFAEIKSQKVFEQQL